MKLFIKYLSTCTLIILIFSCATTTYRFSPVTNNEIELFYLDGNEVAISTKNNSIISIYADRKDSKELILYVEYKNLSDKVRSCLCLRLSSQKTVT